jgi:hypothetical protein
LLIAIAAVLVGIFFAATGRGGELAYEHADHAPLDLGPVSAADIALLRPPTALWGYNMQVTDEALDHIARAMRERDVTIAYLQEQLATLEGTGSYAEPRGAYAREDPETPETPKGPQEPEVQPFPEATEISAVADTPDAPEVSDAPEVFEAPEALETTPEALETTPQALETAQAPEIIQAPRAPRTTLVLKASQAKALQVPEPHQATQPSDTIQAHEATQPSAVLDGAETSLTSNDAHISHEMQGPQGSYDTHDWWAEQEAAARDEAAEEQGW